MRIIQPGKDLNPIYTAHCLHCECVFEFEQSEGKVVHDFRDGDLVQVKCPHCKQTVSHNI